MKFVPLHDRLLIRRNDEVQKKGGLYIPDIAQDKPQEGIVLAVGDGHWDKVKGEWIPLVVKEGDTIVFGKYAGSEIKIDGEELLILKEEEIYGILVKDTKRVA